MRDWRPPSNRDFLMKRMGDLSQLAGTKRYEFLEGRAKGVDAVDFRTGGGLSFTVLPGRGMDIAWADYKGVPLSYISKTGLVSATHYEAEGLGWLRGFFGGLLTTCGLSNVGAPCEDEAPILGRQSYGLHGRISNIVADNVCVKSEWQDDAYVMSAEGRMREANLHGENLTLTRRISARLGENCLHIMDRVRNEGFRSQALMLLYHINFGYPLLDAGARFALDSRETQGADALSKAELGTWGEIGGPVGGAPERLYFHKPREDATGLARAIVANLGLELGIELSYRPSQLEYLVQWKQLGEGEYVLGIEPANCLPVGRREMRNRGGLQYLEPGETRDFELGIAVLDGGAEIDSALARVGQRHP
jgi:hypothetical protein